MRVTIDDQVFVLQRRGGISRYFTELLRLYRESPTYGVEPVTPFRYVVNEHLRELDPHRYVQPRVPQVALRNRVLQPLNRARVVQRGRARQLIHHTYYLPSGLRVPAARRVCTIYDMTPELFPELFPFGNPHAAKREYVDLCDAILCISETTKLDLIAQYGPQDKPVVVTHLGVADRFRHAEPAQRRRYLLFVGQRVDYKNFDVVLRAMARIAKSRDDVSLLCIGGPPFDTAEVARIAELGLDGVVSYESVPDSELPGLYAGARCFIFPSRYEGFGLPTVEAFAAGCPVLLADTPCSVEVGGEAAQFFAPDDDERLAELADRLVDDSPERNEWIRRGRLRSEDFTWQRTAAQTADVYRELGGAQ